MQKNNLILKNTFDMMLDVYQILPVINQPTKIFVCWSKNPLLWRKNSKMVFYKASQVRRQQFSVHNCTLSPNVVCKRSLKIAKSWVHSAVSTVIQMASQDKQNHRASKMQFKKTDFIRLKIVNSLILSIFVGPKLEISLSTNF